MTQEDKDKRYYQLLNQPVPALIERIIMLEDENEKTRDLRRRLMQIRNLTLDPGERRPVGRPRKEKEED